MIRYFNLNYQLDLIIIIFFSFFINFYYSSIGVLPQDTFAYYDTGYRVLNGAVPFKDYWTVSGPIIDYIQSIFFYFFGVNWKVYTLNGSVINCLITFTLYFLLRTYKLKRGLNFFYCICFSVLANPSMGVAFPDHYSTFFSLIAVFLFLIALKIEKKFLWYLIPFAFFLAFFSKQSPSSYIFISTLFLIIFYIFYFKKIKFLKYLILTSVGCIFTFVLFMYMNKISFDLFLSQYFLFPQTIASERLKEYQFTFNNIIFNFKFIYILLFLTIYLSFLKIKYTKKIDETILVSFSLMFISISLIFHQIITKNFIYIFFLIPLLASFLHLHKFKMKQNEKLISIFLILFTIFCTFKYHLRFNESRKMLNLENVDLNSTIDAETIHLSLKGLNWTTKRFENNTNLEIDNLKKSIEIIKNDNSKKMIETNYLFFSAIVNEDLNNPSRWPTLGDASNPDFDNEYHIFYKEFINKIVEKKKIKSIYSTFNNKKNIFFNFDKNCKSSELVENFLYKLDLTNC